MKRTNIMKAIEISALALIGMLALLLIFCEPDENQSVARFLWTLVWTKALGIALAAIVVGRIHAIVK
jgi:hypothetical protein